MAVVVRSSKPLNPNARPYINIIPNRVNNQNQNQPFINTTPLTLVTMVNPVPVYYPMVFQTTPFQISPPSDYVPRISSTKRTTTLSTTVMIRNIPNKFSRSMLVEFMDQVCYAQNVRNDFKSCIFAYDFLYLPMDFTSGDNLGYAFVNFTSTFAAGKIWHILSGYRWGFYEANGQICESKKICKLSWAVIQGSNDLVRHFQNSRFVCDNDEYLPVLFTPARDGATSSFSPKTVGTLSGYCHMRTNSTRRSLPLSPL